MANCTAIPGNSNKSLDACVNCNFQTCSKGTMRNPPAHSKWLTFLALLQTKNVPLLDIATTYACMCPYSCNASSSSWMFPQSYGKAVLGLWTIGVLMVLRVFSRTCPLLVFHCLLVIRAAGRCLLKNLGLEQQDSASTPIVHPPQLLLKLNLHI